MTADANLIVCYMRSLVEQLLRIPLALLLFFFALSSFPMIQNWMQAPRFFYLAAFLTLLVIVSALLLKAVLFLPPFSSHKTESETEES